MNVAQIRRDFGDLFVEALYPEELDRVLRSLSRHEIPKRASGGKNSKIQIAIVRALVGKRAQGDAIPSWLRLLEDCLMGLCLRSTPFRPNRSVAENIVAPVVSYFAGKLIATQRDRINRLLTHSAWCSLEASLSFRLAWTARFAIQRDWDVFCSAPAKVRQGRGPAPRTNVAQAFFKGGVERRTVSLLRANGALARLWAVQGELWCLQTADLLRHIELLAAKLSSQCLPVTLVAPDQSDWHRGNRAVIRIRLQDSTEWYYKPRSGRAEMFWAAVLGFCGPLAGRHFHAPRLILGKGHFWMQAVSHRSCKSLREVAEFYFKAGIILSLLYRLRGVDFHADNLIAHGSDPVLIDCETLLHPPVDPVLRTVRGIGFLPAWDRTNVVGADSLSALGRLRFGPHAVMVRRRRFHARDFCDRIVAGFTTLGPTAVCRRPLMPSALTQIMQKSGFGKCRFLFRSTGEYHSILDLSLQPAFLGNARLRRHYLRRLCKRNGASNQVIRAEVAALQQADIPIFYGSPARPRCVTQRRIERQAAILVKACRSLPVGAPTTTSAS